MLQLFAQCRLGGCDDQLYSPVGVGYNKVEHNACEQLNINSNRPSDCHGDGNTILVGAPKTTRQFDLTA